MSKSFMVSLFLVLLFPLTLGQPAYARAPAAPALVDNLAQSKMESTMKIGH